MMTDKRMGRGGATIRQRSGRLLAAAGAVTLAWAAVVLLSGGVALDGGIIRVSSRDPMRPLLVAFVLLAAARAFLGAPGFAGAMEPIVGGPGRRSARVAVAAAFCVLVVSIAWS